MKWKRTLLLVLIPVSLALVTAVEYGNPAIGQAIKRTIIAALKNPLGLLDERSPGGRGPGVLLSIKGPHERVLSTARERELPPAADNPFFVDVPDTVASLPVVPPQFDTISQNQTGTPPPFMPFVPFGPQGGLPGGPPSGLPGGLPSNPIIPIDTPTPTPPNSPPSNPPTLLPETPGTPPGTIVIPEPASWVMMILGLFAIGAAAYRRARK